MALVSNLINGFRRSVSTHRRKYAFVLFLVLSGSLTRFFYLPDFSAFRSSPSTNKFDSAPLMRFLEAPDYWNGSKCPHVISSNSFCTQSLVRVAMILDVGCLRGTIAAVHSVIKHTLCPENIFFHFIASDESVLVTMNITLRVTRIVEYVFPSLRFKVYLFREEMAKKNVISFSNDVDDEPLSYARIYLGDILEDCVERVIYLDSDAIVLDDIEKQWKVSLTGSRVIGAPEYCSKNFTSYYFKEEFWSDPEFSKNCHLDAGVMVMDLKKWRGGEYTKKIERWVWVQREKMSIYDWGSLPPFLLVFAGGVEAIGHRWNHHGLGGSCRSLHPGPVSLLHWSGQGKPWTRIEEQKPCPVDALWKLYDLKE